MRKIFSVLLALSVLLTICGCAVQAPPDSEYSSNAPVPTGSTESGNKQQAAIHPSGNQSQAENAPNSTQKPVTQPPAVLYQKINYDNSGHQNKAAIDEVSINGNFLYITYTILEHTGGTYDNFATDAVYYDDNNNILRILQVMYTTDIDTFIGQQFVDQVAIPDGTTKILINSASKDTTPLVSADHGNSDFTLIIPEVCYDRNDYGNRVTINSYNIYDGKIFIVYTPDRYYGGGYTSFSANALFYNANGAIIKTSQLLYAQRLQNTLGLTHYRYTHIPDGTVKIEIRSGAAPTDNSGNTGNTDTPETTPTTPSQPENRWTKAEATTLDNYVQNAVSYLKNAQSAYNSGRMYYPVASQYCRYAADYIGKAVELLKKEPAVTLSDGTTLLSHFEDAYPQLAKLDGISITTENADQYADAIWDIAYNGSTKVATLKILSAKLLSQF